MTRAAFVDGQTVGALFESFEERPFRTFRQFAEDEIVIPGGPQKGSRYACDYMPFTAELLHEFDLGRYAFFWGSGPAQAGKTLHFVIIPVMYHLFEIGEDVILLAPTVELAKAVYKERILPVIELSRFEKLLPRKGAGSKGGSPDSIRFRNGARLRFMGAGGSDAQRSSHTARVGVATEVDKMSTAGETSEETDPVNQLIARTRSYKELARIYAECTMSTKQGRIYREIVTLGTDSQVLLRCPRCRVWIWPTRAGLVGWQEAVDEVDAQAAARFQCPRAECRGEWTEEERLAALRDPRIKARGQEVGIDGAISGELPRTRTFGFRWNAMASPFASIPGLAAREWKAAQSTDEGEEKAIVQFDWAEPWVPKVEDLNRPDVAAVLSKMAAWPRKVIPPDTVKLTLGVDSGSYVIWWLLMAWFKDGRGHIVDWDGMTVHNPGGVPSAANVFATFRDLRDRVIKPGWGARGPDHPDGPAPGRQPEKILVDSGFEQETVFAFVLESGEPRYLAAKGFGSNKEKGWSSQQAQDATTKKIVAQEWRAVRQPTGNRLVLHHADHWKSRVHDGLMAGVGAPGSITIPAGSPSDPEFRSLARQLVAEERTVKVVAGHDPVTVWVQKHSRNHWLDCAAEAVCGADIEGVKVVRPKVHVIPRSPTGRPTDAQMDPTRLKRIRTKY